MEYEFLISNFKSIKNTQKIKLYTKKLNIIFGENSSGKSTVIDSIAWSFGKYNNSNINTKLTVKGISKFGEQEVFNTKNPASVRVIVDSDEWYTVKKIKEISEYHGLKLNMNLENMKLEFTRNLDGFWEDVFVNTQNKYITDLGKIKNSLYKKYEKLWPKGIFENIDYFSNGDIIYGLKIDIESAIAKIKVISGTVTTKEIKEKMMQALNDMKTLENLSQLQRNLFKTDNVAEFNNIIFSYSLIEILTDSVVDDNQEDNEKSNNKTVFNLLCKLFGGQEFEKNLKKFISITADTDSKKAEKNKLREAIEIQANYKIKDIFSQFRNIRSLPKVNISNTEFQVSITTEDEPERLFGTNEAKYQSSGFKAFFWTIILLEAARYYKNYLHSPIILIDEPDKNIHYSLQIELSQYLNKYVKDNNILLVISSHSGFMISNIKENNILITKLSDLGNTLVQKHTEVNNIVDQSIFPIICHNHAHKWIEWLQKTLGTNDYDIRIWYVNNEKYDKEKIENHLKDLISETKVLINTMPEYEYILSVIPKPITKVSEITDLLPIIRNENYQKAGDYFLEESVLEELVSIIENNN